MLRVPGSMFDTDTVEARMIRAEAIAAAVLVQNRVLECELAAVDEGLRRERAPVSRTRLGQIRWLGDRARSTGPVVP